jgi:hypothetical protein
VYRNTADTFQGAEAVSGWTQALAFDDAVDVKAGVTYHYFVVSAADSRGELPSDPGIGDAGYRALAPPVNVLATTGVFYRSVGLSWVKGAKEATHYRVYRSTSSVATTAQPISDWKTVTYYDDALISPDLTYYYWVTEAIDENGTAESGLSKRVMGYAWSEIPGDIDGSRYLELKDAILALQVVAGALPQQSAARTKLDVRSDIQIRLGADINGDGKIGMAEVLYIMRTVGMQEASEF